MKKIYHIIRTGALMLLAATIFVACIDGNNWTVDLSHARLFGTQTLSVAPRAVTATVAWTATPNTEYYILEVSRVPLSDEVPVGQEGSLLFGNDGSITQSPYTVTGLLGEHDYYIRIKSMNGTTGMESRWRYLEDAPFTTEKEEIIREVADGDITDESITLRWEPGLAVTHFSILQEGAGEPFTQEISAEEAAAGSASIAVEPVTTYTIYIYNGAVLRGETTVTTKSAVMVESSMSEITRNTATFSWDSNIGNVTGYALLTGEGYPTTATGQLTAAQISNHSLQLGGLEPNTTYTVAIMRNSTVRALQTFRTAMGIPGDYTRITVSSADEWNAILAGASGKVAVIIPSGASVDMSNNTSYTAVIPESITSLIIWGGDEDGNVLDGPQKPTFGVRNWTVTGDKDEIIFYNVNLKSNGTSNYIFRMGQAASCNEGHIGSVSFISCRISDNAGIFVARDSGAANGACGSVSFEDCVISDIGNYSLVHIEGTGTLYNINSVSMANTTVYNDARCIIRLDQSDSFTLDIANCTFYNCGSRNTSYYWLRTSAPTPVVSVSSTLFADVVMRTSPDNISESIISESVFYTNDCSGTSYADNWATLINSPATDLFQGPSTGDFTVGISGYAAYGDPRWNNK